MANFYDDNEDLRFYVDRGIDWEPIARLGEHDFKAKDGHANVEEAVDFYRDVFSLIGNFVAEEIAPHWQALDEAKPKLVDGEVVYPEVFDQIFEQIKELDLHGLSLPRELGGMNAPLVVLQIAHELFARADVSVCAHHSFHGSMALAALFYSVNEGTTEFQKDPPQITKTRFQKAITEMITGAEWGSMDITESDAGSDMAKLRSKGELDDEGNWFVTGSKIFITSGHGKWHFVIARTEKARANDDDFAGLKGLSMFLVPAFERNADGTIRREHTTLDGLEDKLGHNGSATVAISFDRAPAYLIGKRGEGFAQMLMLMNGARVGVGFESLGLCEASRRMALAYAAERRSMGKTIDQHEMIADYLDEMATDCQAIRALAVHACWHEELSRKIDLRLRFLPPADESEREAMLRDQKRHARRSRHLTPLLKYYAAEKSVEMTRRAVQIHGGAGYIKEVGAEKLLRDAMVMPIYEGTSQIQALMAMKDNLLGAVKRPRRFLARGVSAHWKSASARDPLERRVAKLQLVEHAALRFLLTRLTAHKLGELPSHKPSEWLQMLKGWDPKRDFALALLHAERLTRILADVAVAEELWQQAQKFPERRELLSRWLERAEPRCQYAYKVISTTGLRLLSTLEAGEGEQLDRAAAQ